MDKELIQYIDATDNMQLEYLESKIVPDFIKLCNPEWNENVDENEVIKQLKDIIGINPENEKNKKRLKSIMEREER